MARKDEEYLIQNALLARLQRGQIDRRQFLTRMMGAGLGIAGVSAALAGCAAPAAPSAAPTASRKLLACADGNENHNADYTETTDCAD